LFDIIENNVYNLREELKVRHGEKGRKASVVRIGSIQDKARLDEVFSEFKPKVVFHAAAYKHVPLMEECPRLAMENNVVGTYLVADCARRHGVERFVMISTDKAVNPTNVMGATKRLAELLVLGMGHGTEANPTDANRAPSADGDTAAEHAVVGEGQGGGRKAATEFICVRFGNVLDSNGSVIPLFKRQIEAGGPVTVTHPEIIRYFMTIPEAARLVLEAGAMAAGGEIFILDMGEPVKIVDLAESLIRMAGLTPDVDIKIEYIGLRPGEKLFEELLLNEEGLARTINDKIFVVKPEPSPQLAELLALVKDWPADGGDIRGIIKRFVPEYRAEG
jgi:FlaA1/EpsC-like NDP-sugar epimerase